MPLQPQAQLSRDVHCLRMKIIRGTKNPIAISLPGYRHPPSHVAGIGPRKSTLVMAPVLTPSLRHS